MTAKIQPAPSGTSVPLGGSQIGSYYSTFIAGTANWAFAAPVLNLLYLTPIWLEAGTLDRIAQEHGGSPTASEVMRLGLYSDSGRGAPSSLLLDAGTIDLSTATAVKAITISQVVTRGLYWLAAVKQGPTSTATVLTLAAASKPNAIMPAMLSGGTHLYDAPAALVQASVSGALPASLTLSGASLGSATQVLAPAFVRYGA